MTSPYYHIFSDTDGCTSVSLILEIAEVRPTGLEEDEVPEYQDNRRFEVRLLLGNRLVLLNNRLVHNDKVCRKHLQKVWSLNFSYLCLFCK